LSGRGHRVRILTSLFQGLREYEALDGVGVRRISVRRKRKDACSPRETLSFMRRSWRETQRLAEEFVPDAACAFFAIPGGPAAWRLWRKRKVPYAISLRGSDVPRPELARRQRLHLFTKPLIRRVCRDAAALVAVSDALRDAALELDPKLEIDVIPNGVDAEFFRPPSQQDLREPRSDILFVGRLRTFKGVRHALRALPEVERQLDRPVRFTVVGDGPRRQELQRLTEQLREEGMRSEVRFAGWLDPYKVRSAYAASSILVLPSLVEGHPNVILEAMAMGLPCVASDAPGIRGVVTHGSDGLLVPPEDPGAIADALVELLRNEDMRREMGRAGREQAERLSWDMVAGKYERLLERAAGA